MSGFDEFSHYLVAYVIQAITYGITLSQTIIYFMKNKDGWRLRLFISVLFILNTMSMSFIGYSVHAYLLRLQGAVFNGKTRLLWSNSANVEITNITLLLVQLFFARQVYCFCRISKVIPILAVFFALASLCFGTAAAANNIVHNTVSQLATVKIRAFLVCASALSVVSDLISVGAMCWELFKTRDSVLGTRSVVATLLHGTVNRGILVLVWQFLWCIWAATSPTTFKWGPIFLSLPGVYTNTCLAMLNCRMILRSKMDQTRVADNSGVPVFTHSRHSVRHQQQQQQQRRSMMSVTVAIESPPRVLGTPPSTPGCDITSFSIPMSDSHFTSESTLTIRPAENEGYKFV